MRITIISLVPNKLVIEPIKAENSYSSDLSIELSALKKQLAANEINLLENRDYSGFTIEEDHILRPNQYRLKFEGKTQVLRALFAVPTQWINFEKSVYSQLSEKTYLAKRSQFTLAITDRECSVYDLPLVENTHSLLLKSLLEQIKAVHQNCKQPSTVIKQLEIDLVRISEKKNDLWGHCNFYLSCAALYHALKTEEQEKTVKEGSLSFIGLGDSALAPKYKKIFDDISQLLRACKGCPSDLYQKNTYKFLEDNYYPLVKNLEPNVLQNII